MQHWELILFFFGVAVLYGSIGFGGGSSYLAILALYGFEMAEVRSTALLCNIVVVAGSSALYLSRHLLPWRRILPLVAMSIPMAFVGGMLPIGERAFFLVLATALCIAACLMWFQPQVPEEQNAISTSVTANTGIGAGIGFLSGMVGIGGGIFLSPLLHLIRWAQPKVIAATAAVFILANSIAGLSGQATQPGFHIQWTLVLPLLGAVLAGGQLGSRMGISYFSQMTVKRATAVLVLYVSLRIFVKYLF